MRLMNGNDFDSPKPRTPSGRKHTLAVLRGFGGLIDLTGKSGARGRALQSARRHRTEETMGLAGDTRTLRKEATAAWMKEVSQLPDPFDSWKGRE